MNPHRFRLPALSSFTWLLSVLGRLAWGRRSPDRHPRAALPALLVAIVGQPLAAQITVWQGGTADWFAPSVWFSGQPSSSRAFQINNGGSASLTSAAGVIGTTNQYNALGALAGQSGSLTVSGAGSMSNPFLIVGFNGTGSLVVSSGGTLTTTLIAAVGYNAGSSGTATVTGANSTWTATSSLGIGGDGTGTLTIVDQGTVNATTGLYVGSAGLGTVNLTGTGSRLNITGDTHLGSGGTGILNISGGTATGTGTTVLGNTTGSGTLNVSNSGNYTVGSYLSVGHAGAGASAVNITSGGVVTTGATTDIGLLAGATGTVTVSGAGSQLNIGTILYNGYLGTGALTVGGGGVVSIGTFVELGVLSGGSGTLNLNPGGTLRVGGTDGVRRGAAGTAAFNLAGGTVRTTGSALTTSVPATLTNTSTIDTNNLGATFSGVLSGPGGLAKTGAGTLTLSATNLYTGGTTVSTGTVAATANNALGTGAILLDGGAVSLSPGRTQAATTFVANSGPTTFDGSGTTLTTSNYLEIGHGGTATLNVSGRAIVTSGTSTATALVAGDSGTIVISGSGSALNVGTTLFNGYAGSGAINVNSGGVLYADTALLGAQGTGSGTLNVNAGGTLQLGGLGLGAGTGTVNLAGGTFEIVNRTFTTAVPLHLASSTTSTIAINGLAVQFDGVISGGGALTKSGSGIVTLNGANTYSGGTAVESGTLTLARADALSGTAGAITLNGGMLDLGGFNPVLPKVVFNGGTFGNGTLSGAAAFEARTGALYSALGGPAALTKTGAGTFTLGGTSSYLGGTTVSGGLLSAAANNALGTGPITVDGGSLSQTGGYTQTAPTFVARAGTATFSGAGTALTASNYLEVGSGGTATLNITGAGKVAATTSFVVGVNSPGQGTVNVDGAGSLLQTGTFFGTGYSAGTTGTLALGNGAAATVGQYALVGNEGSGAVTVASGASLTTALDLNLGLGATGSGALTISTGGDVTTGLNGYVGYQGASAATVTGAGSTWSIAGYLEVGHGATGSLSVLDGGQVTAGTSTALGVAVGATGSLGISGAGSTLNTGTTLFAGFGGTGIVTVANGGSVAADTILLASAAGSSGTLNVNSGSTLRLGGLTQGAGAAAFNLGGGTMEIINRSFTTSVPLTLLPATTSTLAVSGLAVNFSGPISGAGGLTKTGSGVVTLSGANTYSGATTVNAGRLHLAGSAPNSAFTVNGGATLSGTGPLGALTINSGGGVSPGASPGTLFTGAETWHGGGSYTWELNNATGVSGINYDLLSISGGLTINATNGPGDKFTINLTSLSDATNPGLAANFNANANYSFTFVTLTSGSISGFSADKFTLNTAGTFQNPFTGTWSIASSGSALTLNYTGASAIPEPSTYAVLAGSVMLGLAVWRRRQLPR